MSLKCIWDGPNDLGKGAMWHPKERAFYWIDVPKQLLHGINAYGAHKVWPLLDAIGAVAPYAQGGVIASLGNEVVFVDTRRAGSVKTLATIFPKSNTDLSVSDGKVDRKGRFWLAVVSQDAESSQGGLYYLDVTGKMTQIEQGITVSGDLAFSANDQYFYCTDALKCCVYRYDFDLENGTMSNRQVFLQLEKKTIKPSGLTVDGKGYIWLTQWNSGCLLRYAPDGQLVEKIGLPVERPTSCIFAGDKLDTLYITSCAKDIDEVDYLPTPAGGLFTLDVGVVGLVEPGYRG